jgi:hypothetical protein
MHLNPLDHLLQNKSIDLEISGTEYHLHREEKSNECHKRNPTFYAAFVASVMQCYVFWGVEGGEGWEETTAGEHEEEEEEDGEEATEGGEFGDGGACEEEWFAFFEGGDVSLDGGRVDILGGEVIYERGTWN